jgi:iron complex transport system ATP-binding protein
VSARLVADRVSFAFGARTVVTEASVEVAAGELVTVLGPNGSGKTTLLRLLAGLVPPATGTVRLDGRPLPDLGRREIARRVAVVPQDPRVEFPFTALEVTLMGRAPHQRGLGLPSARDLAIAEQALAQVDAAPLAGRVLERLSGGERQRVFLARALAQEPDVLLLDEPTTHLDVRHQLAMHALVRGLCRERGLACAAVVHDLNLALAYADRVVVLAGGQVVAAGVPADTLTPERVAAVFGVQVARLVHPVLGTTVLVPHSEHAAAFARPEPAC